MVLLDADLVLLELGMLLPDGEVPTLEVEMVFPDVEVLLFVLKVGHSVVE